MQASTVDDSIKKSKISYLKCTSGELHQGQLLTFVCVDSNCKNRGLICPVCKANDHEDHKVLPLKIFLNQMKNKYGAQTSESELNSLSDYLRMLQNSKKQLLTIVKETVVQISDKVRKLQSTIVQNYASLRKMVLTQSTVSTKLPKLINRMLDFSDLDSQNQKDLQAEFQRYADLLRYENDKVSFFDNCRKIVEDYSNVPGAITAHLSTLIPQLTKIFDSLPLTVGDGKNPGKPPAIEYTFSNTNKCADIKVLTPKQICTDMASYQTGGYVFVNEGQGNQFQSIAFKINANQNGFVSVGLGLTDILKSKQYILDGSDINHGAYVISSIGTIFHHKEPDKQEAQSFVFGGGDIIEVLWNKKTKKLQFSRRNGLQKFAMDINLSQAQMSNLAFMVGLFEPQEKVSICE